mgnify:CR=1 FL=1
MSSQQIEMKLPDGKVLTVERGSTSADVAAMIGPRLAKAALAAVVDGQTVSLMEPLESSGDIRILTEKDAAALPVLRHSAAHVLATAVRELRPGAGIGFGPAIEEGFYYDFDVEAPFTPERYRALVDEVQRNLGGVGRNGPAVIRSTGHTDFTATKRVELTDAAFSSQPAHADATNNTDIHSISKRGGGMGSRMVSKIGWQRAGESKSQANAIAADHAEDRIERIFNRILKFQKTRRVTS